MDEFVTDVETYQQSIRKLVSKKEELNKTTSQLTVYEQRKRKLMIDALYAADKMEESLGNIQDLQSNTVFTELTNKKKKVRSDIDTMYDSCHILAEMVKTKHETLLDKFQMAQITSRLAFNVEQDSFVKPYEYVEPQDVYQVSPSPNTNVGKKQTKPPSKTTKRAPSKKIVEKKKMEPTKEVGSIMKIVGTLSNK